MTTENDLTCPKCEGRGFISGLAGCSGHGDPEEEFVTEECGCFAGTLRCGCCGREEAVAIVADGTAEGMPVGERCRREREEAMEEPMAKTEWQHGPGCGCKFDSASLCPKRVRVRTRSTERAEKLSALDREWLAAGAEIRAERARGAA